MRDLWGECYAGEHQAHLSPEQFKQQFCRVCRNEDCKNSLAGTTRWSHRMRTQEDVLLNNPQFADPRDPRYEHLRSLDFPDMLRQAMALEISAERGDWEIPSAADAVALVDQMRGAPSGFQAPEPEPVEPAEPQVHVLWEGEAAGSKGKTYNLTLASVDGAEPTWSCSCPTFIYQKCPPEGCKHIVEARALYESQQAEVEVVAEQPLPRPAAAPEATPTAPKGVDPRAWTQMRERNLVPSRPNTRFPSDGLMVDGSAAPSEPTPAADPWAVPTKREGVVVPVGARVVMGGTKPDPEEP